ncbi:MAG TPA: RES family NAD+ phosphorylase [Verrucomicrobiae bacterium]|jgi:RES domain-containing protein
MVEAWRIVKAKHAASAFSGEGAARNGGRWNSRGVPMVYASATISLAALETLVHLNPPPHFNYVVIQIKFDESMVHSIQIAALPSDWQLEPPPPSSKAVGDAWVHAGQTAVLAVPSAIISSEVNYLLNPAHADFKKISIAKPQPFAFDPRLVK